MFEIARFESRRRLRAALFVSALLVATVGLVVGLFPSIEQSGVDFEAYVEAFPPEIRTTFIGSLAELGTIEGFLVTELYQFVWSLLVGLYVAAAGAGAVAGEAESGTLDLLLVNPVTRTRVVVGKALSLLPLILLLNGIAAVTVLVGVSLIGEHVRLDRLLLLHAGFVVYHAASGSVGLVASVLVDRVRRAQGIALGALFATYLLDSLTVETDYEWLGELSLSRHFDPGEVLVAGDVDWLGLAVLVGVAVVGVIVAAELFERRDVAG